MAPMLHGMAGMGGVSGAGVDAEVVVVDGIVIGLIRIGGLLLLGSAPGEVQQDA